MMFNRLIITDQVFNYN